jgi:hypothetical protein
VLHTAHACASHALMPDGTALRRLEATEAIGPLYGDCGAWSDGGRAKQLLGCDYALHMRDAHLRSNFERERGWPTSYVLRSYRCGSLDSSAATQSSESIDG